jgi:hypothetical protein
MNFYIKEWENRTATLMTDTGQVLWTFPSKAEAYAICREYYAIQLGQSIPQCMERPAQPRQPDPVVC